MHTTSATTPLQCHEIQTKQLKYRNTNPYQLTAREWRVRGSTQGFAALKYDGGLQHFGLFGQHLGLPPYAIIAVIARNKATMRRSLTENFEEAIEQMNALFSILINPYYL